MKFLANAMSIGDKKIPFPILAIEVFSIVLGVMLALWASEWSNDRANQKLANKAMLNIAHEFENNHGLLTLLHNNNVAVVSYLEGSDPESSELSFIPGLQLQNTAWTTFLNTGVSSYIDYNTILQIAEVYSIHEIYKTFGSQMAMMSFEQKLSQPSDKQDEFQLENMKRLLPLLNLIIEIEAGILEEDLIVETLLKEQGFSIAFQESYTNQARDSTNTSDSTKTTD
jgi:hypothetical protein